jgi:DNA repair protein RadC
MAEHMAGMPRPPVTYEISPRRVCDIPKDERPREVFDREGPEGVSDRVLLAVILRSGVRGVSVVDLADRLLNHYGSLTALAQVSVDELRTVCGIGRVKAQVIKAALELARRLGRESLRETQTVRTPEDAARLLRGEARVKDQEVFWVLLLDTKYRLRRPPVEVTRGILDASLVHPREVFKEAIRSSSAAVVLVHNHPSGDPAPSAEDIRITRQLVEAGKIMDIEVLDHVILGRAPAPEAQDHMSLRESGLVAFK